MLTTCDIYDQHLDTLEVCDLPFTSYGKHSLCYGEIVPVLCYQDNSIVKKLLTETDGSGKVLVVDAGGVLSHAMLGDLIATNAVENNWQGIIINGAVRDIGELTKLEIHIKALGHIPRKTNRQGQGRQTDTLRFGNAEFVSGHWLCSDQEGLVISSEQIHL